MGIMGISTNDNGLLREEKPIQRLSLQQVSSVTTNKAVQIGQYMNGIYAVMSKRYSMPLENSNLTKM